MEYPYYLVGYPEYRAGPRDSLPPSCGAERAGSPDPGAIDSPTRCSTPGTLCSTPSTLGSTPGTLCSTPGTLCSTAGLYLSLKLIFSASAELDPASLVSLPGPAMDHVLEGTGTVVLWTWFHLGVAEL